MKPTKILALIPSFLLCACATTASIESVRPGASGASLYCGKARLLEQAGGMTCNWESTAKAACRSNNLSRLDKSSISDAPKDAGRCDTGDWLVQVRAK